MHPESNKDGFCNMVWTLSICSDAVWVRERPSHLSAVDGDSTDQPGTGQLHGLHRWHPGHRRNIPRPSGESTGSVSQVHSHAAELCLKPQKCSFVKREVTHLGYVVSGDGISPDSANVAAFREFPQPSDLKTLRSFLGLASYHCSTPHIPRETGKVGVGTAGGWLPHPLSSWQEKCKCRHFIPLSTFPQEQPS